MNWLKKKFYIVRNAMMARPKKNQEIWTFLMQILRFFSHKSILEPKTEFN
jgi:hypothetical protein